MDPASVESLASYLGTARLRPYLARYHGDERLAVRLHAWNAELATAFWGPIGLLEVCLRNAIHDEMRRDRPDDWWNYSSIVRMTGREASAFKRTLDKLAQRGLYHPTADDVVAETSLGLWVGLLDVGEARHPFLDYETALWAPRVKNAFPHRGGLGRRQVHAKLNRVRVFRNRIAHHEPIYNKRPGEMRDLVLDCLALIDPAVAEYVRAAHRIDEVLGRQQQAVAEGDCRL